MSGDLVLGCFHGVYLVSATGPFGTSRLVRIRSHRPFTVLSCPGPNPASPSEVPGAPFNTVADHLSHNRLDEARCSALKLFGIELVIVPSY